ncbi:MAG: phytanoyl-CoA dioxygenase family protein [Gemmatimonadales bacterium]
MLSHAEALRENGFTIYRGLFSPAECTALASEFKAAAGITEGVHFTRTDATNKVPVTRKVLFDPRVLGAVREALGDEIRFVQPSDLHYLHDTVGWHRDSVHRAQDNSLAADWAEMDGPFGVVKAILYMEADSAGMGIMAGSHLSPQAIDETYVKAVERRGGQIVVDRQDEPNRRLSPDEKRKPLVWVAGVGDVLVFDQRMYHCGRRVVDGVVSRHNEAPKFCLSMVFGRDNLHSERFYSYFRYARRELGYRDFDPEYREQLEAHDLIFRNGLANYYERHPEELRLATLRKPETMDGLVEEFAAAGRSKGLICT